MANSLTGNYDVVVEVRPKILDGLLAGFHRNGGSEAKSPRLLHSLAKAIGGVDLDFEQEQILSWMHALDLSSALSEVGSEEASEASSKAPPGVSLAHARAIEAALAAERQIREVPRVKGKALTQVSTPTVSFAPGATAEVTASMRIRVHFVQHPDSVPFPRTIHGAVQATFQIASGPGPGNTTVVDVLISPDDSKTWFEPDPALGMSPDDVETVSAEFRNALRNDFEPVSVDLEGDFPFQGFKALGSGADQVVALPIMLDGPAPGSGLGGVSTAFLGPADHFGIAVAREVIDPEFAPVLSGIEAISFQQTIDVIGLTIATYTVSISNATLTWQTGQWKITVTGSAVTGALFFPNYDFTVTQNLTLQLDAATQTVTVVPLGAPSISGLPDSAKSAAQSQIAQARDNAIAAAQSQIQQALVGRVSINDALDSFDGTAPAFYTAVDIVPEGVILRGQIEHRGTSKAQINYAETADKSGFSALRSWMPGGWIEEYHWSWKEVGVMQLPWGGAIGHSGPHPHSFILPKPANDPHVSSVCLVVKGTQVTSTGSVVPAEGGEGCSVRAPSWMVATMPSWYDLLIPIWDPAPLLDARLDEQIRGHLNGLANAIPRNRPGANSLVHFVGDRIEQPLSAMSGALSPFEGRGIPMVLTLVLPRGSLAARPAELEKRLGVLDGDFEALIQVTEDYDGAWSRAFGYDKGAATYAMNARGQFVWRCEGPPDGRSYSALERHFGPGRPLRYEELRPPLRSGQRAVDFQIPYAEGRTLPLRRLRGRPVEIVFWKSWSAPCRRELRRLRRARESADGQTPLVVAVNGGEERSRIDETARDLELDYPVVPDPGGRIARAYGVNCWPTTLSIDAEGSVSRVQIGLSRVFDPGRADVDAADDTEHASGREGGAQTE